MEQFLEITNEVVNSASKYLAKWVGFPVSSGFKLGPDIRENDFSLTSPSRKIREKWQSDKEKL